MLRLLQCRDRQLRSPAHRHAGCNGAVRMCKHASCRRLSGVQERLFSPCRATSQRPACTAFTCPACPSLTCRRASLPPTWRTWQRRASRLPSSCRASTCASTRVRLGVTTWPVNPLDHGRLQAVGPWCSQFGVPVPPARLVPPDTQCCPCSPPDPLLQPPRRLRSWALRVWWGGPCSTRPMPPPWRPACRARVSVCLHRHAHRRHAHACRA